MTYIKQKPFQNPTTTERNGIISFDDVREVHSFGLTSYIVVCRIQQFAKLLERQLEIPRRRSQVPSGVVAPTEAPMADVDNYIVENVLRPLQQTIAIS